MSSKEMNYQMGDYFILFLKLQTWKHLFLLLLMGCSEYMSFKRNLYSCHKRIKKKTTLNIYMQFKHKRLWLFIIIELIFRKTSSSHFYSQVPECFKDSKSSWHWHFYWDFLDRHAAVSLGAVFRTKSGFSCGKF